MSAQIVTPPNAKKLNPLLAAYLRQLASKPLLTKSTTAAILSFLQEYLATNLSSPIPFSPQAQPQTLIPNSKAFKLSAYSFFISAPLAHLLFGSLQRAFRGREGKGAKVGMLIASNAVLVPIQSAVYMTSLAVINGARSVEDVLKVFKSAYWFLVRTTWVANTASVTFAQNFLPPETWVPFFNFVTFILGTYFNTKMKKAQLKAEARKKAAKEKAKEEEKDQ